MSGHSHAKTILHKKQITDAKRGKIFSKLSRQISVAVREKGSDPKTNPALKIAIEQAKKLNVPKENIEKAIKRGAGELEGAKLESIVFEAYGPGEIAIIIEGITDNRNRALGKIKQILNQNGGKLVGEGGVKWMFKRRSCITLRIKNQSEYTNKENLELLAIEAGAEDVYWHNAAPEGEPRSGQELLDVYTKIEDLERVKKNLEEKGIKVESVSLNWVPKEEIEVDKKTKENCQKLFEVLDENDSVQEIYSNLSS